MLVLNDMTADARVDREAAALASAGHEVSVLALRSEGLPERERRSGFTIHRVAGYTTATWRNPLRKIAQGRARRAELLKRGLELQPDVIHSHDSDTLVVGGLLADLRRAPLVYDAHELYPDMIAEFGLGGSFLVQAYWRRVERKGVLRAQVVLTVSEHLAAELANRFGVNPVVVRNVPELTSSRASSRLREEVGADEDTGIVLYQGVLISGRGLPRLASAMRDVPGAILVIQGFGPELEAVRSAAAEARVSNRVRLMGRVEPSSMHEYACGADVGVVIYEHTTLNNFLAAPNKLYAYLMAGLPIAASDFPGIREVVEEGSAGVLFDPSDESSIAAALSALLGDRNMRAAMGARARELAETKYNWDLEKQKLLDVYDRLAARSTS